LFCTSRRRHTRVSRDWSSDVCSSDLRNVVDPRESGFDQYRIAWALRAEVQRVAAPGVIHIDVAAVEKQRFALLGVTQRSVTAFRSEERSVGKEGWTTIRS